MRKDRQTDMIKLIVAFHNFANASKNFTFCPQSFVCVYWMDLRINRIFFFLYVINWLVFKTETQAVHWALRIETLITFHVSLSAERVLNTVTKGNQQFTFIHLFTWKSLELFNAPLCAYVFQPVSEMQRCTRKRLYCTIGESKYYFYPHCFSLSFYILSFFCFSPFYFGLPHSDTFLSFCAWLRFACLLFLFLLSNFLCFMWHKTYLTSVIQTTDGQKFLHYSSEL